MKVFVLASALGILATAGAMGADLPARRAPPLYAPPPPIPVFTWTGFYAGANAGYAFDERTSFAISPGSPGSAAVIADGRRPGFITTGSEGFTGGGQIGYNLQLGGGLLPGLGSLGAGGLGAGTLGVGSGGIVVGLEADAAYTDLSGANEFDGPLGLSRSVFRSQLDFLGTVRGRIGYAFGPLLVFGTGGFAYGGVSDAITYYFNPAAGPNYVGNSSTIRTGYTYGGGIEYAIPTASPLNFFRSSAVTLKVEYLHYDLGASTVFLPNLYGSANSFTARINNSGDLVRAGLNFKFGQPATPAPVVARY